jgi:hypothetical protein
MSSSLTGSVLIYEPYDGLTYIVYRSTCGAFRLLFEDSRRQFLRRVSVIRNSTCGSYFCDAMQCGCVDVVDDFIAFSIIIFSWVASHDLIIDTCDMRQSSR